MKTKLEVVKFIPTSRRQLGTFRAGAAEKQYHKIKYHVGLRYNIMQK